LASDSHHHNWYHLDYDHDHHNYHHHHHHDYHHNNYHYNSHAHLNYSHHHDYHHHHHHHHDYHHNSHAHCNWHNSPQSLRLLAMPQRWNLCGHQLDRPSLPLHRPVLGHFLLCVKCLKRLDLRHLRA